MARKKQDNLSKPKLDLGKTLYALDTRDFSYYNNLTDEEKKKYIPLILMRFMSSAPNQGHAHEYHVSCVNDFVNQDFWTLTKHPELQHMLMSLCGIGHKQYHNWIAGPKRQNLNKLFQFISSISPGINDLEFKLFLKLNTKEDIEQLAKDHALSDEEIEDLLNQYEKTNNDAGDE